MTIPLFEKYRPKVLSEVVGQTQVIDQVKAYLNNFTRNSAKKKAVILHGSAGTGKTTIAYALANELNLEIFELNASDLRNRQKLNEILRPSTEQKSLFSKSKLILVDEVDGVTATDYGGLAELIVLIERSKHPLILTCNDIWQNKFSLLRSKCELIAIKEVSYLEVLDLLKKIIRLEEKIIPDNILKEIAAKSRGDIRASLNDLQSVINIKDTQIVEEEISLREKSETIFNVLREIFKIRSNKETINLYENVDMDLDQISLWIEENIPTEYRGEELAKAFDALSKADIFKGRIHRQQYWHFLTYQNFFLTAGIASAKGPKNLQGSFTKYNPPKRILKIWMINQKEAKKKSIAGKIAEAMHISKKTAMKDFTTLTLILDEKAIKSLNLSEQELEYLQERKTEAKEQIIAKIKK